MKTFFINLLFFILLFLTSLNASAQNRKALLIESGESWSPKDIPNLQSYIRSWEGLTTSGTDVVSCDDLSGNGRDFTAAGATTPQFDGSTYQIGGVNAINFAGGYLEYNVGLPFTVNPNNYDGFWWIVFQLTSVTDSGGSHHGILMYNANHYTSSGSFIQFKVNSSSTTFTNNFANNSLDDTITKTQLDAHFAYNRVTGVSSDQDSEFYLSGTTSTKNVTSNAYQHFSDREQFIGSWNNNDATMNFCEAGFVELISDSDKDKLIQYISDTYGIN